MAYIRRVPRVNGIITISAFKFIDISSEETAAHGLGFEAPNQNLLFAWGNNGTTLGAPSSIASPTKILAGVSFSKIFRSHATVFAIELATGHVWCWGKNNNGQLGLNDMVDRITPTKLNDGKSYIEIAPGNETTLFLDGSGTAYECGFVTYLGVPRPIVNSSTPTALVGGRTYVHVTSSSRNGVEKAAIEAGTNVAYLWGGNFDVGIGVGTTFAFVAQTSPAILLSSQSWSKIAIGNNGAITGIEFNTGKLWSWGQHSFRLGLGGPFSFFASTPIAVLNSSSFIDINQASEAATAIEGSTGNLYGWGNDQYLGVDTLGSIYDSPVKFAGSNSFTKISLSTRFGIAIEGGTNDTYVWGQEQVKIDMGAGIGFSSPVILTK